MQAELRTDEDSVTKQQRQGQIGAQTAQTDRWRERGRGKRRAGARQGEEPGGARRTQGKTTRPRMMAVGKPESTGCWEVGPRESLGAGTDRQTGMGPSRHLQSRRRAGSAAGLTWGESRGAGPGGSEAGGRSSGIRDQRGGPFPTWGPNLVLHTQGTEGDYHQITRPPCHPPPASTHP